MRCGFSLLLLAAAAAINQATLLDAFEHDGVVVGMQQRSLQENQNSPPVILKLPLEILVETLKHLGPMDLRSIPTANRQFHKAIAMILGSHRKDMKKQYLQDPTVPKADEQQHSELQQPDPSAADAQFNKYFWRHLQFRWDCGLLPRSSGLGSSQQYITTDVVIDNFQDNLFNLCRLYLQSAPLVMLGPDDAVQIPLGYIAYPDLSRVLSVPYRTDYGDISSQLNKFFSFDRFQPYNAIENGAFGAFNHGYVMEIPDLMERYLEVINEDDLYLPLQALQENAVYDIFIKVIALEDPARVQYFFNDIMAYQVIPNFVMAHVGKGYYDQALAFINRMRTNTYLSKLFNRIPADGHPNYYEQAVYMALGYTMNENATKFVMRLIAEHNLRINRMYQCELSYNLSNVVKDNLKSLYDEELLSAPVAIEECLEFTYQFFRGSRLNLNYFGIYGNI